MKSLDRVIAPGYLQRVIEESIWPDISQTNGPNANDPSVSNSLNNESLDKAMSCVISRSTDALTNIFRGIFSLCVQIFKNL